MWLTALMELEPCEFDEKGALEAITALERLKRAAAGGQARLSVRVDERARARQRDEGLRADKLGRGVGAQIALARLESPHKGGRHLGLAKALASELPKTIDTMVRGEVSEWQATLFARETACLDLATRRAIDALIASRLHGWGDAQTVREVARLAYAGRARLGGQAARPSRRGPHGHRAACTGHHVLPDCAAARGSRCRRLCLPGQAGRPDPGRRRPGATGQGAGHGRHPGRMPHRPESGARRAGRGRARHAGGHPPRRGPRAGSPRRLRTCARGPGQAPAAGQQGRCLVTPPVHGAHNRADRGDGLAPRALRG